MSTKKYIEVNDWDNFVTEVYGKPYAFQQQDGCKSRGVEAFTVTAELPSWFDESDYALDTIPEIVNGQERCVRFADWLARDPKQPIPNQKHDYELELFWYRSFYPVIDMITQDLCVRGLLEPGEYVINIDW